MVLNSKKTKLQGGKHAGGAAGKAVSTYVSPSASSSSFIVGNNPITNSHGGPQVKMTYSGQHARDKGNSHGKHGKAGANGSLPGGSNNPQYVVVNNCISNPGTRMSSQHPSQEASAIAKYNAASAAAAGALKL